MASFKINPDGIINGLTSFRQDANIALSIYAETAAKTLESYTKQNRPWTDRTSRARQGLTGYVNKTDNGYRIIIAHTVDYGVWLEYAHEKRFAILEPTIRLEGPKVIKGMKNLLNSLKV